jgi:integrase
VTVSPGTAPSAVRNAELVVDDPTSRITRRKVGVLLPRPIATNDLASALDAAPAPIRCMLLLAAYEGIEIARLVREDMHDQMTPPIVIARGKGGRLRPIPLHSTVWEALRALPLPSAGPVFHREDIPWLVRPGWHRRRGRAPLAAWQVSRVGSDYLHHQGIEATMHRLRHWFGTQTYRKSSHDLLLVKDLLGHARINTTEGYAAFDRAGAADAVGMLSCR